MRIAKILIIDDEPQVLKCLSAFLKSKLHCESETVADSKKALERIRDGVFDLVLVDIKMPGLSGIDLIKEASKLSPETKILVISAYDSREIAELAINLGAGDYIPKSYTLEQIGIKIKSALPWIAD